MGLYSRDFIIDALTTRRNEARADVQADNARWELLACGQDSEEAEYSGWLEGYASGIADALDFVKKHS